MTSVQKDLYGELLIRFYDLEERYRSLRDQFNVSGDINIFAELEGDLIQLKDDVYDLPVEERMEFTNSISLLLNSIHYLLFTTY